MAKERMVVVNDQWGMKTETTPSDVGAAAVAAFVSGRRDQNTHEIEKLMEFWRRPGSEEIVRQAIRILLEEAYFAGATEARKATVDRNKAAARKRSESAEVAARREAIRKAWSERKMLVPSERYLSTADACGCSVATVKRALARR